MFKPAVLKWSEIVQSELQTQGIPLPVELILATIQTESGGIAGLTNKKSGASGLMQVMPVVVDDYNKSHSKKTSIERMRDPNLGQEQIKVGIWITGVFWKGAYNYLKKRIIDVPIDQLMKISDLFYVAGPGATRKKLDKIEPCTYENTVKNYTNWNALPHVEKLISHMEGVSWNLEKIEQWLKGTVGKIEDLVPSGGTGIALLALAIGGYLATRWLK